MEPSEWVEIMSVVTDRFPSAPFPIGTIERWGEDLADLDAGEVAAAIEVLYREGGAFPSNSGQIRSKINELKLDAPEWFEVLAQLRAVVKTPERRTRAMEVVEDESGYESANVTYEYPRAKLMEALPYLVKEFIEIIGMDEIFAALADNASGADEARLREKWRAFQKKVERESLIAGIPSGGLARLKRLEGQPRPASDVIADVRKQLEPGDG